MFYICEYVVLTVLYVFLICNICLFAHVLLIVAFGTFGVVMHIRICIAELIKEFCFLQVVKKGHRSGPTAKMAALRAPDLQPFGCLVLPEWCECLAGPGHACV